MTIKIVSFTKNAEEIRNKIVEGMPDESFVVYDKKVSELKDFCEDAFISGNPLIFVSAVGIATRTIAPFVDDKLKDPPVIVCDELGGFTIPILSGHYGGGNELAVRIAEILGSIPVITTGTDVNRAFAVDVFARENNLKIINRDGIAKVSTKAIAGKPITLSIEDFPPKGQVDVVVANSDTPDVKGTITLSPPGLIIGVGCKKGKCFAEINALLNECLDEIGEKAANIAAIATIDIKGEEPGIRELSKELSVPILTFSKELLNKAEGDFAASDFVKETVGVDNVCERAAVLAAGAYDRLILNKHSRDGVTIAIARK